MRTLRPAESKLRWTPILLVVALLGAGCGGGDGDSDEDGVRGTIEQAFISEEPVVCDLLTRDLLEESTGATGPEARQACRVQVRRGEPADAVEIGEVTIEEGTADVSFTAVGGNADGDRIQANLVDEDGEWRIARVRILGG